MSLKRFGYKSTKASRAQAQAVIAHADGRRQDLPGFEKRLVLKPEQIKQVRSQASLTQKDLARLLCVDVTTVQNWEQGRRVPEGPATAILLLLTKHPQIKGWLEQVPHLRLA